MYRCPSSLVEVLWYLDGNTVPVWAQIQNDHDCSSMAEMEPQVAGVVLFLTVIVTEKRGSERRYQDGC
jgi:hypothetical protein